MQVNTSAILDSLLLVTVFAIILERSLALVFEQKRIAEILKGKGLKEIIAFSVCFAVCRLWGIDIISSIMSLPEGRMLGFVLTAAAIAGGSKASIKLFQDVIGVGKMIRGDNNEGKSN